MLIPTRGFLDALLERGVGTSTVTVLGAASIGLIKSAFSPDVDTTYAEVAAVEANYTGYARQGAAIVNNAHVGPGNLSEVQGALLLFAASDSITPNTIFGMFLTGTPSTTLYGVEMFDTPIPLPTDAEQITIVPRVGLDPDANYGLSLVSS